MNRMSDGMMGGMQFYMFAMWGLIATAFLALALAIIFLSRKAPDSSLLVSDLAAGYPDLGSVSGEANNDDPSDESVRDTVFILPDISRYTYFMTGSRFSAGHAQHIVFCLINAMIKAATKTVHLSKLEGDAALFYVDAPRLSDIEIGQTAMNIFSAFFVERERLKNSNICPCRACQHIDDLDLKIFVHRGKAARFQFRGSVDHFGTDVIILHRLMKNGVDGHRYVMVTDAAAGSIRLPGHIEPFEIHEDVEHVGKVQARVYELSDANVAQLLDAAKIEKAPKSIEMLRKFGKNWRAIQKALPLSRRKA